MEALVIAVGLLLLVAIAGIATFISHVGRIEETRKLQDRRYIKCHHCDKPAKWISFQREHATSRKVEARFHCESCGKISSVSTTDDEIMRMGGPPCF